MPRSPSCSRTSREPEFRISGARPMSQRVRSRAGRRWGLPALLHASAGGVRGRLPHGARAVALAHRLQRRQQCRAHVRRDPRARGATTSRHRALPTSASLPPFPCRPLPDPNDAAGHRPVPGAVRRDRGDAGGAARQRVCRLAREAPAPASTRAVTGCCSPLMGSARSRSSWAGQPSSAVATCIIGAARHCQRLRDANEPAS